MTPSYDFLRKIINETNNPFGRQFILFVFNFFFFFFFFQSALADAPAAQDANFEEIFGKVQTAWTKFGTDIQEFFNANLPSQDEIAKNVKAQSDIFVQKIESFSKKLEEEVKYHQKINYYYKL